MELSQIMASLQEISRQANHANTIHKSIGDGIGIYPCSVRSSDKALFFLGKKLTEKRLYIVTHTGYSETADGFSGNVIAQSIFGPGFTIKECLLTHENAEHLRNLFAFTRPVVLGIADSYGFGDRLGLANPAHIRSLEHSHMKPILAQQSVRELERTQRTAEDVLDASTWAVFQEGYLHGFGADADHLKTTEDIDRYAKAGFTMYTFDPSAHVVNEAVSLPLTDVLQRLKQIPQAESTFKEIDTRYSNQTINLQGSVLQPTPEIVARAFLKYGAVITHTHAMYTYLNRRYSSLRTEVEMSVDETDIPTTPFEHYFIANELKRLGVKIVSLAPRFIGDFEKGVDYKGDLSRFEREYRQHAAIARMLGPYKISIHSGSDKFSIYNVIGSLNLGPVHVKTAGTSYLEALRTLAIVSPGLFSEILDFARDQYEEQRKSYHVTGQIDRVPTSGQCSKDRLAALFEEHDARQVLHVTFGKVLSTRNGDGNLLFGDRLKASLKENEDVHYATLIRHFKRHLDPFNK